MSIINTVLIFVLVPVAVAVVVAALALSGGSGRRSRRYRPGRPYDFTPTWFLAAPERVGSAAGGVTSGDRAQLPAIGSGLVETGTRVPVGATGGASDRW